MGRLPAGDVTVLFSDIEGSTRLWEQATDVMAEVLDRHRELAAGAIEAEDGAIVSDTGDGVFAVFADAPAGVAAAIAYQRALAAEPWPVPAGLRVRIGLHRGAAVPTGENYFGPLINRTARVMSVAWGGQIVVTDEVAQQLSGDVVTTDLGHHRLKDLSAPVRLHQVHAPGLEQTFPPLRSLDGAPGNLPAALSELLGRDQDVDEIVGLVGDHRLVTLTGAGGSGKTRLGLQVAAELVGTLVGGAWFVDLARVESGADVADAISSALSLPSRPGVTALDALLDHLESHDLLLVMDNCEHVIDDAAAAIERVLRRAPQVRVLATSREALQVEGEAVRQVPPLPVPSGDDVEGALLSPAVQLFMDRARLVAPSFTLDETTVEPVVRICRRLDGIPLAIELATARLSGLSVAEVAERLDDRFRLLTGGSRTALPRQRTLEATLAWSFDLLDEPARRMLAGLSVFAGTFDLDGAGAIVEATGPQGAYATDLVAGLVDRSLVVRADHGYYLLETTRDYARIQLADLADPDEVRAAHLGWVGRLAADAGRTLDRDPARQAEVAERIDLMIDNIRAAIAWGRANGHLDEALQIATRLHRHWVNRRLREGTDLLVELMAEGDASGEASPEAIQAACFALQSLAGLRGDYASSAEAGRRGLAMAESGEGPLPAYLFRTAATRDTHARPPVELQQQTMQEALAAGDRDFAGVAANRLSLLVLLDGELDDADALIHQALELMGPGGPDFHLSHAYEALGLVELERGDPDAATWAFAEGLERAGRLGNRVCVAHAIENVSSLVLARGRAQDAAALFDAAGAIRESFGAPPTWYECPFHNRIAAELDAVLEPDERRQATERAAGLPDDQAALALTVELLRAPDTMSGS